MIQSIIEGKASTSEVKSMNQQKLNKALQAPWK